MEVTEYGDLMVWATLDEWGRKRINAVLDDGTRVIVAAVPPPPVARRVAGDGLTWTAFKKA